MSNTLTEVIPQLLAQGLMALRENAVMPHLVNTSYEHMAAQKGSTIDIPIPSAVTVQNVTPAAYSSGDGDATPTSTSITMSRWREAPFHMTDKDIMEAMEGHIPMQASEAIKALANDVDDYLLSLYTGVYNFAGTSGVTPFASGTTEVTEARMRLNNTLAPLSDRRMVIDALAEANALNLRAFQDMSFTGDARGIINGEINRKLGFDWFMDQNVPTHTTTAAGTPLIDIAAGVDAGSTTVHMDGLTTAPAAGDVFTIAGIDQQFTVVSATALAGTDTDVTFSPALGTALTVATHNNAAVTFKATHTVNLAFHRDAIAFASRPLADNVKGLGNMMASVGDPISGLSLRLEVSREYKRTRFSYDILYGATLVRPELACRVAG